MIKPNGEKITLFVENFIPYVPNPDYEQSSNVIASKAAPATASVMPPTSPQTVARNVRIADDIMNSNVESIDTENDQPPLASSSPDGDTRDTTMQELDSDDDIQDVDTLQKLGEIAAAASANR